MHLAKIITDSVSPPGVRLTTMEIQIPRIVLAEFNTHRVLSRNSASSRAIPISKMLQRVMDNPYIPEQWGANGKGMQSHGELDPARRLEAFTEYLAARDSAVAHVRRLSKIGLHKQTANRLIEPFMWHTVIVTATEWCNFLNLRDHPAAHPAIARTARAMREAMAESKPTSLAFGEYHLPYIDERDAELNLKDKIKVSIARCARVSYLTHDGKRAPSKDIELHDSLLSAGHMSPFEHVARPMERTDMLYHTSARGDYLLPGDQFLGNFKGWVQYRKTIAGEADILGSRGGAS